MGKKIINNAKWLSGFCCFAQFVYFRSPIKGKVGEWLKPPVC